MKETQKAKIRMRYQGVQQDEIEVIPAMPQENIFDGESECRVAVYTRVSTDDPHQTSSIELQKNHYIDEVNRHPGWRLAGVYSDEGVSGTSVEYREGFQRMIADCEAGKIDMIITKSISRFARNTVDCVTFVRKLASLKPPVGIHFREEGIHTLGPGGEMLLTILSSVAQGESYHKSEAMNVSIEMRFKRGLFLTPTLLGYDKHAIRTPPPVSGGMEGTVWLARWGTPQTFPDAGIQGACHLWNARQLWARTAVVLALPERRETRHDTPDCATSCPIP
ncbi:MAG: recombinase family protein [Planctomycetaceae bacterium]|nr:recombinase family protein [Planctomycetaceae bacterium]